ncbi:MAG: SHOCT domain-containing protein [Chloroflexi bacterium]|nr:SHOCT domain-containing protein [Chloroflexota bacterium]
MFHGFGYGMGLWGGVAMLLFWAAIVALGVWFTKSLASPSTDKGNSARAILDERYAQGELSREEYQAIKSDLNKG